MSDTNSPRMRPESRDTVHAIANAIELGVSIMGRVAGGDIANTLDGVIVDTETHRRLIASSIRRAVVNNTKGGKK